MSSNNLTKTNDKTINEDSLMSGSTTNSFNDSNIQDFQKDRNAFIIAKMNEAGITDILSYLHSDTNLANNKLSLIKYLQSLFDKVSFNPEILLRKFINERERLNLYQIIINQYIFYTNPGNT